MDIPRQDWYDKAADSLVRGFSKNLFEYCNERNLAIKKAECDAIIKTSEFQASLRAARNKFYKELANDPQRSRNTAVGQLLFVVMKLIEAEQYEKAVAPLTLLFKAEGWNKEANNAVNIFQEITGKDLSALRKRLGKTDGALRDQAENPLPN